MKTYTTHHLIDQLEQQTEAILHVVITQWQMMNPAIVKEQPAPGAWSAMQCLGHLNSYGNYYLPAIEKAIDVARTKHQVVGLDFRPGWLGDYFARLMMPGKDGVPSKKMKAMKGYQTSNEGDSDAVIATFIEQQEKLLVLLHQARKVNMNDIRIPVSIAKFIRLKLGDVFRFLIAHNLRHIKQAERAIAATRRFSAKGDVLQNIAIVM